jgi:hypothetical protein
MNENKYSQKVFPNIDDDIDYIKSENHNRPSTAPPKKDRGLKFEKNTI